MHSYISYLLFVFLGFVMWWLLLAVFRRAEGRESKLFGYLLLGPVYGYLKRRNYSLTRRELIGSLLVCLLMLSAPFVTKVLEG